MAIAFKGETQKGTGEPIVYPLLPWKWLGSVVALVVALSLYADDVGLLFGFTVTDQQLIRYLPPVLLGALVAFFGPTGYWAPWRVAWRWIPTLNGWFPDVNGVWLGTTGSNWPTLKKMLEGAQAYSAIDQYELHSTPEQRDALAVQITASLFQLRIAAGLSSTDARSYSVAAKPRRDQHSGRIRFTYVYEQTSPDPAITDEENHMGAADLILEPDNLEVAEGVYWTRRNWKTGLNTAGHLELRRIAQRKEPGKSLRQYAADEKGRLETRR